MTGTNISFMKERNGYSKEQVDNYIKKLSEAYQTTYNEFLDISGKYKSLLDNRERSDKPEQTGLNPDIAAKTLINTEMLAQKIIADAQADATAIMSEASKIRSDAETEAAKAKEAAQKTIDDANSEAALMVNQVRKNIEQAYKTMEQAANEVNGLLTIHLQEEAA